MFENVTSCSAIINVKYIYLCLQCPQVQQRLLWFLSLLDCVEVALEVLTQRYLGEPSKWGAVIVMQLIRYHWQEGKGVGPQVHICSHHVSSEVTGSPTALYCILLCVLGHF